MIQIESRLTKARVEPVEKPGENGARSTMIQNAGLRPLNIFARLRGLGILVIGRV